jgi:GNAT superfamily N-acetyltransferase
VRALGGWDVETDVDDATAYAAFATDRLWCGYAIADLEPPFRAYSQVAIARRGAEVAACLVLRHPAFNSVVPHGPQDGLDAILERIELPQQTHLFALEEHLPTLRRRLTYAEPMPMLRMAVDHASFRPPAGLATADRLGPRDLPALTDLYLAYPGNAFNSDQLTAGVFYGVREGQRLLAATGTHVVSPRYGIAAVGSIFTRPEARGRGLAVATTSAVVTELLAAGCRDAILNVAQDNAPARRVYAQLGFREHGRHYEGMASATSAPASPAL